ncbi:MarR family winged helix-turn-helix transcriptional regulator [Novosphingobium album (ex Liu et al. 2023)]|uniref:MarR family transcriptional regulator n=1 Tax=Novosphingobium album (ex Liu et al. 2023) TaxID=3031130 RepID=A0ABT5WMS3_9SPHN|nr:MarR family transcriptional regulator [Novosphingobium album (ex Liu et al. 2023)]MDE8651011.1 MarR family transcriptional regulator [Novosphingobium album (ex Liu et al. 2023)]
MPAVSDLTSHTGYLLRMVSNAVSQEFARKVRDKGVTVAEWAMLRCLYGTGAIAPSALARKMGMTKGAISKLADRLLEKGLIERTGNPEDKRGHSLSLSVAGANKVPILAGLADENDAAFFAFLSGDEHERLRGLLHTLIHKNGLSIVPVD